MRIMRAVWVMLALVTWAVVASGQEMAQVSCDALTRSTYLLGPDDEVHVSGPELDEPGGAASRVDGEGDIQVPLVGRVHVAGLTVQQAQQELNQRLRVYIRDPQITVSIKELRSQPVSILGAVNTPGLHQVRGHKTLLEMLSVGGGVRADAGQRIRITRQLEWGCIPLPNARLDASGKFSVGDVSLKQIMTGEVPHGNVQILPHDVISVPRAEMVYVIGDVKRSGGFVIGETESMSVLQVLSLAEGMNSTADKKRVKILRPSAAGGQRAEIAVNVSAILEGKSQDVALHGDDILFIPSNTGRKASMRALEAAIQTGSGLATGLLIWRRQ
jgi:polysaccharide biosynthesis/export protein